MSVGVVDDRIAHIVLRVVDDLVQRPEADTCIIEVAGTGRQVVDRGHVVVRAGVREVHRDAANDQRDHVVAVGQGGIQIIVGDLVAEVGVEHAGGVVGVTAIARNILVVIVVAVGAFQHRLELRTVHADNNERILVGHEREHVADQHLGRRSRSGRREHNPVGGTTRAGHGTGQVEVHIRDAVRGQFMDRSIGLQVGGVGLGDVGVGCINRGCGVANDRVVVGGQHGRCTA